jgi:hypothetical protein
MHAGIQFHRLEGGSVGWSQSSFSDHSICKKAYGTGKDMKHLAEGKIGKAYETG